jgi:hypothetical protein
MSGTMFNMKDFFMIKGRKFSSASWAKTEKPKAQTQLRHIL